MLKRMMALLMILSLSFTLMACGSNENDNASETNQETEVSEEPAASEATDMPSEEDASETDDSLEESNPAPAPMQVQDNLEVAIGGGEEGAW